MTDEVKLILTGVLTATGFCMIIFIIVRDIYGYRKK